MRFSSIVEPKMGMELQRLSSFGEKRSFVFPALCWPLSSTSFTPLSSVDSDAGGISTFADKLESLTAVKSNDVSGAFPLAMRDTELVFCSSSTSTLFFLRLSFLRNLPHSKPSVPKYQPIQTALRVMPNPSMAMVLYFFRRYQARKSFLLPGI